MSDDELAEKITAAVIDASEAYLAPGLISYEADQLYEDTRTAVALAIAQHRAPLGR